jgi:hypothetical protein
MKRIPTLVLLVSFIFQIYPFKSPAQQSNNDLLRKLSQLEEYDPQAMRFKGDWLIHTPDLNSGIYKYKHNCLVLSNGLISRTFALTPNGATVGFNNLVKNVSLLRAVKPEAVIILDDHQIQVGGLTGQPVMNYFLDSWIEELAMDETSMRLNYFEVNPIQARFEWKKRLDWMPDDPSWPPKGIELVMSYIFESPQLQALKKAFDGIQVERIQSIEVEVHYEMYDGLPLLSKWIVVHNHGREDVFLASFQSELLAFVEPESVVGDKASWKFPLMSVETDYAFGGSMSQEASVGNSYKWMADADYQTIINYSRVQPTMLVVEPKYGPGVKIAAGDQFESYRVYELIHDSPDRERQGLALRKMYRTISPWIAENPILMHVRRADDKSVKTAIDQCADVGFEMVIMTFGSGFNIEDSSATNWKRLKALGDYAHSKGIALGGYSLLASRSIDKENDVVMPEGQKPRFNNSPCLQSNWGRQYFDNLYRFYEYTGLDILEHDGSYPGDICISNLHPGHNDINDSQWKQFEMITDFYKWCRERGIYLNVPDWYFLNGSNKTGMGYRETNWSLPRKYQEIIERQNVYDGTWEKTPSMGWMFVPLVQYHGGGNAATIEPLKDHLGHYEQRLANLFGAGVQACYRGPRLYDAPETREIVKKWVDFYLRHRKILDSDVIHVRRPDGRDFDGLLHADPSGEEKGLLMLYNPLDVPIQKEIEVDLYYTGLKTRGQVCKEDGAYYSIPIDPQGKALLDISIPANKWTWYVFKQ